MKKTSKPVVFFGSGPVAAKSLSLLASDFYIEVVVTKPKPTHHKGDFPVISLAEELGLRTIFTRDAKELSSVIDDQSFTSTVGVVIDYGILMDRSVIDKFPLGLVNSHFSLLPKWRGPDPISFAIVNGDLETGVSLMLIVEALDEGDILAQQSIPIAGDASTPSLTSQLIDISHNLLIKTLPDYMDGKIKPKSQQGEPTYSRKLTKDDSRLDPNKPAAQLEIEVRAYLEWPRSHISLEGYDLIVTAAHVEAGDGKPGSLWRQNDSFGVYTTNNILVVDKLIVAGKKEMPARAFLAGYKLSKI